jgi:glucokinase
VDVVGGAAAAGGVTGGINSYIVGIDNGGNANKPTVLDASGRFLVNEIVELPSLVLQGPDIAVGALAEAFRKVLELTGVPAAQVRAVGLDTPGPASADGVISSKGSTNFSQPEWRGFDIRAALEAKLGLPVVYSNDGNAAALYAHHVHFGAVAAERSSVAAVVGTGLGGGLVESGHVIRGAAGMAGELGHIQIPLEGLLEPGQLATRKAWRR